MEIITGIFGILSILTIIFIIKFKIKFDVIDTLQERHYIIWYTASKYHQRKYILLFTTYK